MITEGHDNFPVDIRPHFYVISDLCGAIYQILSFPQRRLTETVFRDPLSPLRTPSGSAGTQVALRANF